MKKNIPAAESNAITNPVVLLNMLAQVSASYESQAKLRRELARLAVEAGATYQQAGDAMGRDRSTAHTLINGRAA